MSKVCSKCKEDKNLDEFYKRTGSKDGHRKTCKSCMKKDSFSYHSRNRESILKKRREVYKYIREDRLSEAKQYYQDNLDIMRERSRQNYYKHKSGYKRRFAKRRANLLQATPSWCRDDDYQDLIEQQELIKDAWGLDYHIDHYYPLQGKTVCGLHCTDNWQLISAEENLRKNNKMPEEFYDQVI